MNTYQRGETPILLGTITDSDGTATSPTVSCKVYVVDPGGTLVVNGLAATESATGSYYYAYKTTSSNVPGEYQWLLVTVNGTGSWVTIAESSFVLEAPATPV